MGSLMAGWNCPVVDPETARLERNRSLTKEEIDSFWKVHRKSCDGEEQEEPQGALSPASTPRSPHGAGAEKKSLFWQSLERIKSLPRRSGGGGGGGEPDSPVGADKVAKLTGDWWTRSNWAFLNEPPHDDVDDSAHKYTAQFHVAEIATEAAPLKKPQHA